MTTMHSRPPRPGRRNPGAQDAKATSPRAASPLGGAADAVSPSGAEKNESSKDAQVVLETGKGDSHMADESNITDASNLPSRPDLSIDPKYASPHASMASGMPKSSSSGEIPLEAVENALRGLSRDELVLALKRAKEQMDILDTRLETLTECNEVLEETVNDLSAQSQAIEADRNGLELAITQREERIDELMREQDRLEEDVYLRSEVNERLRKQLDEAEKARAEAERRYSEQSTSIDRERQHYLEQEKMLSSQKSRASSAHEKSQAAQQELLRENERLQKQLTELRSSSPMRDRLPASRSSQLNIPGSSDSAKGSGEEASTADADAYEADSGSPFQHGRSLQDEADAVKIAEAMRAEHDALQARNAALNETMQQLRAELHQMHTSNADLRQQNQMFADILQEKTLSGELGSASAVLNRFGQYDSDSASEAASTGQTSDVDDVPDEPKWRAASTRSNDRRASSEAKRNGGDDLASELQGDDGANETGRQRTESQGRSRNTPPSDLASLQRDNKELRDANQALTLYVNKILDRIIAREGYENVLAVESEQRRSLRSKASRMQMKSSAPSSPEKPRSRIELGRGLPSTLEEQPETPIKFLAASERARKTMSRDWRSYLPAMVSSNTAASPQTPESSGDVSTRSARRIRSSEEIEDKKDEQERERIRENMQRQGIVLPEHQLKAQKRQSTSFGTFFSRVLGAPRRTDESDSKGDGSSNLLQPGPYATLRTNSDSSAASGDVSTISDVSTRSASPDKERHTADALGSLEGEGRPGKARHASNSSSATTAAGSVTNRASLAAPGDTSRGPSEAGDESYGYLDARSPEPKTSRPAAPAEDTSQEEGGWRKALKRVSLLYPVSSTAASTGSAASPSEAGSAPAKSPSAASPSPS